MGKGSFPLGCVLRCHLLVPTATAGLSAPYACTGLLSAHTCASCLFMENWWCFLCPSLLSSKAATAGPLLCGFLRSFLLSFPTPICVVTQGGHDDHHGFGPSREGLGPHTAATCWVVDGELRSSQHIWKDS